MALAVLQLVAEAPTHPYEIKQKMRERGIDRAISLKGASLYDTVERLAKDGLIEPIVTNRDGRRPERTIYKITQAGGDELESWLRRMLEEPSQEYPRFGAALMFIGALRRKDEAIKVLERRALALEAEIAAVDAMIRTVPVEVPRLFVIEDEYVQAMRRAELGWLRSTVAELNAGSLEWPEMLEAFEWPMS